MIQSFVIFIPFGAGDRTQFQIPARSQIFTLCAISADEQDETNLECTNQDLNLEKVDQL